jgi:hypothetical protein
MVHFAGPRQQREQGAEIDAKKRRKQCRNGISANEVDVARGMRCGVAGGGVAA